MAGLFLSLQLDTASRRLSIECSPFRVQGQICVPKAGVQAYQPSHRARRANVDADAVSDADIPVYCD